MAKIEFVNATLAFLSVFLGIAYWCWCLAKIKSKNFKRWQILIAFFIGAAYFCFGVNKILRI